MVNWLSKAPSAWLPACALVLVLCTQGWGDEHPVIAPADRPKTGKLELVFAQRSPLSDPKEIARRLNLKEAEMGADYDLAKCPFKAYVPTNYDPATPCGIFVYLNYKDTDTTPPKWHPILEQSHLIFISPVCNSVGVESSPVQFWQMMGLAFDAVDNLKRQYAIDDRRIYEMFWNKEATRIALTSSDVFTGFVLAYDQAWFTRRVIGNGGYYPADYPAPPEPWVRKAKNCVFVLIGEKPGNEMSKKQFSLKVGAMRADGFEHVMETDCSSADDLHYPNFSVPWFAEETLPFLDANAKLSTTKPTSAVPATMPTAAPALPQAGDAQRLLSAAQLYVANGKPELARPKLQQIIDRYPSDPAAAKAKQLLDQFNGQ